MMYFLKKISIYIFALPAIFVFVLSLYGYFDNKISFFSILKNHQFYTTLFAFASPIFSLIIAKYNKFRSLAQEDKIKIKNSIEDILNSLQDNIRLFEQKCKVNENSDFSDINGKINMDLSKLTKQMTIFYDGKREKVDAIVGTIIFEKVNNLSNNVHLSEVREVACEISNISERVKREIKKSLYKAM